MASYLSNLFIYLNSLGFGIHLFTQQASVESLQHNRCTAVNETNMASWGFHSARKSNSSSSNWDMLHNQKNKGILRLTWQHRGGNVSTDCARQWYYLILSLDKVRL